MRSEIFGQRSEILSKQSPCYTIHTPQMRAMLPTRHQGPYAQIRTNYQ